MNDNDPIFCLPSGRYTRNVKVYVRAWNRLMKPFAKTFDLRRHSMDPGCRFTTKDGRQTFDVPIAVLTRFNETIVPLLKKPRIKS